MPLIGELRYTKALDYDGSNRLIYQGLAIPGTASSEAAWSIQRYTYDGAGNLTAIEWVSGTNEPSYVWDDRATYSYS